VLADRAPRANRLIESRGMQEIYITSQTGLDHACGELNGSAVLAVDTEFLRVRTYYPRLCLLQIASTDFVAVVDPLADLSLEPVCALLTNAAITKVIHAAYQDLEVLYQVCGNVPAPLFDTQIAAALLGYGEQLGYAGLAAALLDVEVAKLHTRTDWCRRPLSREQHRYAVDDVRHLGAIYDRLRTELSARGRLEWCMYECRRMTDDHGFASGPENAFQRIRGGGSLPPDAQHRLRALAMWREQTAQQRNLPRNWVISDSAMITLAAANPVGQQALAGLDGVDPATIRRYGRDLLNVLSKVASGNDRLWPRPRPMDSTQRQLCSEMLSTVRKVSRTQNIAQGLLATRRDVEALVRGDRDAVLLQGWRRAVIGDQLLALLDSHHETRSNSVSS